MIHSLKIHIAVMLGLLAGAEAARCAAFDLMAELPELELAESAPVSGTFFSLQRSLPPFPFNPFPGQDLFTSAARPGVYFVDDLGIDWDALTVLPGLAVAYDLLAAESSASSLASFSLLSANSAPPDPGGGGSGDTNSWPPFVYTAPPGLKFTNLTYDLMSLTSIGVTLREHEPWEAYDVYFRTNLVGSNRWKRIMEGLPGQTNFTMPVFPTPSGFYVLGASIDEDGDGLPSAWEKFVSRSNPLDFDSNNDGQNDGDEDSNGNGRADRIDYLMETRATVFASKTNALEGSTTGYGEFTFLLPLVATTNTSVYFHVGSNLDQDEGFILKTASGTVVSNRVIFPVGTFTQSIRVHVPENEFQEDRPRSVAVTLTNFPGGRIDESVAVVTISDDGDKPAVSLFAVDDEAAEPSVVGGVTNSARLRLFRDGIKTNSLTANLTISGTATNGTHYWTVPTSATFPAGSNSVDVVLWPRTNGLFQGSRSAVFKLANHTSYRVVTNHSVATATFFDDDKPVVQILPVDTDLRETGLNVGKFALVRSGSTALPLTINLNYGGTATTNDYVAVSKVHVFATGQNRLDVTVTPRSDLLLEPMEFISFTLGGGPDYLIGTTNRVELWLDDANASTNVVVQLKRASVYQTGVDSPAIIEVTRLGSALAAASHPFRGYTSGGAPSNSLFRFSGDVSGTNLVFAARQTKAYVRATANTTGKTNGGGYLTLPSLTGGIGFTVDFFPAARHVTLSVVRINGIEGTTTTVQYRAARSATGIDLDAIPLVLGGNATPDTDFTPASPSFDFASGDAVKTIDLSAISDAAPEGQESVLLRVNRMNAQVALDFPLTGHLALIRDNVANLANMPDSDSDGDGLGDRWEIDQGMDPLVWDDHTRDDDRDGLTTLQEAEAGTEPDDSDTDNDGTNDYLQTGGLAGVDDDDDVLLVRLKTGDAGKIQDGAGCAVCHSTKLKVGNWSLTAPPRPGVEPSLVERIFPLRKGTNYPVSLFRLIQQLPRPNSAAGTPTTTAKYTAAILPEADDVPAQFYLSDPNTRLGTNKPWASFPAYTANPVATLTVPKIEIGFTNLSGNLPIDANPNWGGGLRVFPDQTSPTDTTARNQIKVLIKTTPPQSGKQVRLRVLDVDDPTPKIQVSGQDDTVVDTNDVTGESGSDNRGTGLALASTLLTLNGSGAAETTLTLPMQPGDNFRVAAVLETPNAANHLNSLQATNDTEQLYVGSTNRVKNFAGTLSKMVTIWRRIHVELDSMNTWVGNKPEPDRFIVIGGKGWHQQPPWNWCAINFTGWLPQGNDFYVGGRIEKGSASYKVMGNTKSSLTVEMPTSGGQMVTNGLGAFMNTPFYLYDDDDTGMPSSLLPRTGIVDTEIEDRYAKAYILPVELPASLNTQPIRPFVLNADSSFYTEPLLSTKNVTPTDLSKYWYAYVLMAYQPETAEDKDPSPESAQLGATSIISVIGLQKHFAVIFLETIRDTWQQNSQAPEYLTLVEVQTKCTFAHELGHFPSNAVAEDDHQEGGIMSPSNPIEVRNGIRMTEFSAPTIKRFRNTQKWSAY